MLRNKKKFLILIAIAGITYSAQLGPTVVRAEGSRELVNNYNQSTDKYEDNLGYRPFLWADDTKTAGITRRTTFKVYAKEGETINLGSSIIKTGSIVYKKPGDTNWNSLNVTSSMGYISTVTQERIGPYITATTASKAATSGGYTPITIPVVTGQAGVWQFQFNAAATSGNPAITKGSGDFITAQKGSGGTGSSTIGAWDITVSDALGNAIPGRMYTPYIAMIVGSNANTTSSTTSTAVKVLNNDFYILTKDGYIYQTSMNGVDPNGFVFWANNRGFIDKTNNKTLYHSVDGGDDNLALSTSTMLTGNLGPQLPSDTDTDTDITHNVFVNKPDGDLASVLNIQAIAPEVPAGFQFAGSSSVVGKTPVRNGGTFSFTATKASSYRLIIDTNKNSSFDLASDVVIENVSKVGSNTITWNGKDKAGNTLPVGTYRAQLIIKGGEYHFPMLDAEYNPFGTKIKLTNAPNGDPDNYADKYKIYYDESNYTTANGVSVNLNASNSAFGIGNPNGLAGVDSSGGAHAYLGNYGNWKGIDTWTYYPGQAVELTFDVTPTVTDVTRNAQEDNVITFLPTDFTSKFNDGATNALTTVKITSLPANGQLKFNGVPVQPNQEIPVANLSGLTFTPNADWNGTTSFSWNGSSGSNYAASDASVVMQFAAVNDPPVAASEDVTVDEDQTLNKKFNAKDAETNASALTYTIVQQPQYGTVTINPDGTYTYKPTADYYGADSFTFKANDGQADSAVATVNITVNSIDDAPVASPGSATTNEDTPVSGNFSVSDIDSTTLTNTVVQGPSHGTVTINSDGSYTYTPYADYSGPDSFTYKSNDGQADSNVETISITVNPVNDAPTAPSGTGNTDEDTPLNGNLNVTDVDSTILTYTVVQEPSHGTLRINSNGTYLYTPDPNYHGPDSFKFIANDGQLDSNVATVDITVNSVNDLPVASSGTESVSEDETLDGHLSAHDDDTEDTLSYAVVENPSHGRVTINSNGSYTYEPDPNYYGTDSFTFKVNDGHGDSNVATIDITVNSVNDLPTIHDFDKNGTEDTTMTFAAADFSNQFTDVDGNLAKVQIVTLPQGGTLRLNEQDVHINDEIPYASLSELTFVPNDNWHGSTSFQWNGSDGTAYAVLGAKANISIASVDDAPVASPGSATTNEDTPVRGSFNVSDIDSITLTNTVVQGPSHGTVTINSDGSYTYTPNADYSGPDSFTFKANDGQADSNVETINITVNPINDAPVAPSDRVNTDEDTPLSGNLNVTDVDSTTLGYTVVQQPSHGTLVINNDGTYKYTPASNYHGSDSFKFKANDGQLDSNVATVDITVNSVNDLPVASSGTESVNEDETLDGHLSAHDDDTEDTLSYTVVENPSHGRVTINSNGSYTYKPDPNYYGPDSFTFKVNDGHGDSNVATIDITVNSVNDLPTVHDFDKNGTEDTTMTFGATDFSNQFTDVDGNLAKVKIVTLPQGGTLRLNDEDVHINDEIPYASLSGLTFVPNDNWHGSTSFQWNGSDGTAYAVLGAKVNIAIASVDDAPVASPGSATTNEDTPVRGSFNVSDIDSTTLTNTVVQGPSHGNVIINSDGSYTYTPNANYHGPDSFTFKANDGQLDSNIATVSITVNSINDIPVANSDRVSTDEDKPVNGNLSASDADGDRLSYSLVQGPSHGRVSVTSDGSYIYTPNPNYNGPDSFTFKANDGHVDSNTATININVNAINDAPVADSQNTTTIEDRALTGNLSASDVDKDTLTYTLVEGAKHGIVSVNPNGSYTYTPNANYNGTDSFTFKANDGQLDSNTATVNIAISGVDDAPVVADISKRAPEDTDITFATADFTNKFADVDGSLVKVKIVSLPTGGTLKLNGNAVNIGDEISASELSKLIFTPNTDWNGSTSFSWNGSDGTEYAAAAAMVNITIDPVNDAPMVLDINKGGIEDTNIAFTTADFTTKFVDVDGSLTKIKVISLPSGGTLKLNGRAIKAGDEISVADLSNLIFTPNANWNGSTSFQWNGYDGAAYAFTAAKVNIAITPVNDAPVVSDIAKSGIEDTDITFTASDFTNRFEDVDGNLMKIRVTSLPMNGTLRLNGEAVKAGDEISAADLSKLTFTPYANWNGSTSFGWNGSDGTIYALMDAKANITITPVNDAPKAVNYSKTTNYNTPVSGKVVGSDLDNDSLSYSKGNDPIKGSVLVNSDGTWVYTPNIGASGTDSFTVVVSDGHGGTATSTVSITIDAAPTVTDYSKTTNYNTPVSGKVEGNDSDKDILSYSKGSDPAKGSVVVKADGTWVYTPNAGATGTDSFTVVVNDGKGGTATSTVSITIDTPPTVTDYNKTTNYNTPVSGTVEGSDADKDSLSYSKGSNPGKGTVVVKEDGSWTYTPNAGATGTDSFTVVVKDGHGGSAVSTINIVIDTPPTVPSYNKSIDYNTPVSGAVIGNDADKDSLTYSQGSAPSKGSVVVNADGTWTYTPNNGAVGSDSFTVIVKDGHGGSATSKVNVIIDTPPTVPNYNKVINYNTAVSGTVVGSDVDKDSLSYSAGSNPGKGSVVVNADGTWTYTPNAGATGEDSFTVVVNDGNGGSAASTIKIVIDTPPTVPDYNRTTPYNKQVSGTVKGSDTDNDKLSYSLSSEPSNGYVYLNNSGEWIYTPKTDFVGTDSFKVEVKDGRGGSSISNITVNVKDKLTLVGTVVDKDTKAPLGNTKIELSDVSGKLVYSTVTDANGNYRIDNVKIGLYKFNVSNSQYGSQVINADIEPTSETEYTMREDFNLAKSINYALKLDSNPITILGDGKSTSILTAKVTDNNNKPVANTKVVFSALLGSFPDGNEAITDENGIARVVFKSSKVYGTENKVIPVTAKVDDNSLNLHVSDQIYMTFEPGMIAGVVVDNETNKPVSGAVVEVSKDFDNDGIADFYSKVVTGADGKYEIAIPKGNVQYTVTITKPVKVGSKVVQVKYNQKSNAGTVTGAGNETYSSERTAAGVILTKETDGNVSFLQDYSNFSIDVVNSVDMADINSGKKELKNISGINAYIGNGADNKGVFEAEGLEKGKDYTIAISYTFPSGQKIVVGTVNVNVNKDGQINLSSALIDPFGTITDAVNHNIITGAHVKLYYADTARNRTAGRTPGSLVNLPGVQGFAPADNKNPQDDDSKGKYAFMVFPDADYYIVVEKDGYETYVSGTISVGKELVKKDIQMKPIAAAKPETKVEAKPEVKPSLSTLPKTGSPIDMETLGAIGFVILASGIGLTLKPKKKK